MGLTYKLLRIITLEVFSRSFCTLFPTAFPFLEAVLESCFRNRAWLRLRNFFYFVCRRTALSFRREILVSKTQIMSAGFRSRGNTVDEETRPCDFSRENREPTVVISAPKHCRSGETYPCVFFPHLGSLPPRTFSELFEHVWTAPSVRLGSPRNPR